MAQYSHKKSMRRLWVGGFAEERVYRNLAQHSRVADEARTDAALRLLLTSALLVCLIGCARIDADSNDDTLYSNVLNSTADFERNATAAPENGKSLMVKFLARVEDRSLPDGLTEDCYFQNMSRAAWHLQFLQSFPEQRDLNYETYRTLVLSRSARRLWGGMLQRIQAGTLPTAIDDQETYAYSVYSEPAGLSSEAIAAVDRRLKTCAPFAAARMAFLPETLDQKTLVEREKLAIAEAGVRVLFPDELSVKRGYAAYTKGEGFGYLRIVPRGQELGEHGPLDVLVVESAPNDISVVAGLITRNPQSELGHVNLRLREKAIPNASVPDVYDQSQISELSEQLVHLVIEDARFVLERAELADAEAFWAQRRPQTRQPSVDLEPKDLAPLTELRAADMHAYGAKCANLGELTRVLSPPHRPDGFGIPFIHHRNFMIASGLDVEVDAFLAGEPNRDASERRAMLRQLRERTKAAAPATELLEAIAAAISSILGDNGRVQFLRFRSSTNVEDLDAFTGAGLYDSRSGCLADDLDSDIAGPSACLQPAKAAALEQQLASYRHELAEHPDRSYLSDLIQEVEEDLTEEKPISAALGKVWASLWNDRAFDERAYYGIDHRSAYMGICVHPAYALERINAVAVSNLVVDEGAPTYRLSSQVGELSVARPEIPTAVPELLTFRRVEGMLMPSDVSVRVGSSLVPAGAHVWADAELNHLSELLFRVHDHFAREVYPSISPLALDLEVKLDQDGAVVIKQVRPYVSFEPVIRNRR